MPATLYSLEYGDDELVIDFEKVNTMADMIALISNLKPQEKLIDTTPFKLDIDKFIKFDRLSGLEIAQVNLSHRLHEMLFEVVDTLLPPEEQKLIMLAKMMGTLDKLKTPIVDPEIYQVYSKIDCIEKLIRVTVDITIRARLGFDNIYTYDNEGTLYAGRNLGAVISAHL